MLIGGSAMRNYLRVRGEYITLSAHEEQIVELPPRARRIRRVNPARSRYRGTTSACAENTRGAEKPGPSRGNYLRVRGEYDL